MLTVIHPSRSKAKDVHQWNSKIQFRVLRFELHKRNCVLSVDAQKSVNCIFFNHSTSHHYATVIWNIFHRNRMSERVLKTIGEKFHLTLSSASLCWGSAYETSNGNGNPAHTDSGNVVPAEEFIAYIWRRNVKVTGWWCFSVAHSARISYSIDTKAKTPIETTRFDAKFELTWIKYDLNLLNWKLC